MTLSSRDHQLLTMRDHIKGLSDEFAAFVARSTDSATSLAERDELRHANLDLKLRLDAANHAGRKIDGELMAEKERVQKLLDHLAKSSELVKTVTTERDQLAKAVESAADRARRDHALEERLQRELALSSKQAAESRRAFETAKAQLDALRDIDQHKTKIYTDRLAQAEAKLLAMQKDKEDMAAEIKNLHTSYNASADITQRLTQELAELRKSATRPRYDHATQQATWQAQAAAFHRRASATLCS